MKNLKRMIKAVKFTEVYDTPKIGFVRWGCAGKNTKSLFGQQTLLTANLTKISKHSQMKKCFQRQRSSYHIDYD